MRKIALILVMLLLCTNIVHGEASFFSSKPEHSDTQYITSLPYICGTSDVTYILDANLITNGYAIAIAASRVVLDMTDDTIKYSHGWGNGYYGVRVNDGSDSVWVEGGTILHSEDDTSTSSANQAVLCLGDYVMFHGVTMDVTGVDAAVAYIEESAAPVCFRACSITSRVHSFTDRTTNTSAAIYCYNEQTVDDTIYNLTVDSCVIDSFPHAGIYIGSHYLVVENTRAKITNNTFIGDGRNDFYDYPQASTNYSSENNYAIVTYTIGPGTIIRGNTVQSGTLHEGCKGFLIQGMYGEPDNYCVISNNTLDSIHRGPSEIFANGECVGFYVRPSPGNSYTNNQYVRIDSNEAYILVDGDAVSGYMGSDAEGFRFHASDSTQHIKIRNNHFKVFRSNDDTTDNIVRPYGLSWGGPDTGMANWLDVQDIVAQDNYWYGASPVSLGSGRAYEYSCNNMSISGDTLESSAGTDSNALVFNRNGTQKYHSVNNVFTDITFLGTSEREVSHWGAWDTYIDSCDEPEYGKTVRFREYLKVKVLDVDSNSVENATFTVTDAYGEAITTGVEYALGYYSKVVSVSFYGQSYYDECPLTDSTFSPFIVTAVYGTDSIIDTITIGLNPGIDTIYLPVAQDPEPTKTYVPFTKGE